MPFYHVKTARGHSIGLIEAKLARTKTKVISATASYQWAIGKELATVSEWMNRKQLKLDPITGAKAIDQARASLYPQGELV